MFAGTARKSKLKKTKSSVRDQLLSSHTSKTLASQKYSRMLSDNIVDVQVNLCRTTAKEPLDADLKKEKETAGDSKEQVSGVSEASMSEEMTLLLLLVDVDF